MLGDRARDRVRVVLPAAPQREPGRADDGRRRARPRAGPCWRWCCCFLALPILDRHPDLVLGLAGVLVPAAGLLAALVPERAQRRLDPAPRSGLSAQIAFALDLRSRSLIGTLCAIAIVRGYIPGGRAIATLMVSPLMVPGLVLGIAFLQAAREFGLRDAYATLLLAHVVVTLPFIMRTVLASLSLFDFTMVDAARMLGLLLPGGAVEGAGAEHPAGLHERRAVRLRRLLRQLPGVDLPGRRAHQDAADPAAQPARDVARSDARRGLDAC